MVMLACLVLEVPKYGAWGVVWDLLHIRREIPDRKYSQNVAVFNAFGISVKRSPLTPSSVKIKRHRRPILVICLLSQDVS